MNETIFDVVYVPPGQECPFCVTVVNEQESCECPKLEHDNETIPEDDTNM